MRKTPMIFICVNVFLLQGCIAAAALIAVPAGGLAKMGLGAKPQMLYLVESKEITIDVSTYSVNITSIKNMTEVGAALVADEVLHCPYIALTYAKWPNNLIQAALKINTTVVYECTNKPSGQSAGVTTTVGAIVDVKKKLKFEQDLVNIIRTRQLLKEKGATAVIAQ